MTALTLPSSREEAWRWTDLAALETAAASPKGDAAGVDADALFLDLPGARLLFVDGVLDTARSTLGNVALTQAAGASTHELGQYADGAGWELTLTADAAAEPVQIVHVSNGGTNHLPARISLAAGASASVIESFAGRGWANRRFEATLARGASLNRYVRLLQDDGFVTLRDEADVGERAQYNAVFLGAGQAGSRIDGALNLTGEHAHVAMGGALLTRESQKQECAVAVRHAAANGASRQIWRAVAADTSAASLAARVEVARNAQKTDGEQSLRGLLLKRTATVNLKPELEIFADDVKCAHGATVGELDAKALFYLQSRGIPAARAKALLTHAFVADALDEITDETVRDAFSEAAGAWLEAAL